MTDPGLEERNPSSAGTTNEAEHPAGCLVRPAWLMAGPVALVLMAAALARNALPPLVAGTAFWGAVAMMLAVRYVDITRFDGLTANGEPATLHHYRSYAASVLLAAAALFGGALWMGS